MKKFNKNDFRKRLSSSKMDSKTFDEWMDNPENFNDKGENNTRERGHGNIWDKIRNLFNQVHDGAISLQVEEIRRIDNEFLRDITRDSYFSRLSKAPMSSEIFESIEKSNNKHAVFDSSKANNDLFFLNEIRNDINEIHENKQGKNKKQDIFAWVKWFSELVTTISSENQDTLSVKINQAIEDKGQSIIKFEAYDPFSFFYFLAQKNTTNKKKLFFQSVDRVFNVSTSLPNFNNKDCWVFPTPTPLSNVLYKWNDKYEPELLWDFFQQIISIKNVDELATKATDDGFIDDFKMVLDLTSVGVPKLTQTLFLINPNVFFTIDWILKPISHKLLDNPNTDTEKNIKQLINSIKTEGFSAYLKIMQKIHALFTDKTPYEINHQLWENGECMDDKLEKAISVLKNKKQIILQGSPGTGKTRLAKEIAYYLIKGEVLSNDEKERQKQLVFLIQTKQYKLIQFHPAYSYEDFVRGIVATTTDGDVNYEVQNKVLAEMAENAIDNPKEDYVLIIDEINRANLSSVLGELIYALEYRGESVESMYKYQGSREIILPENLYIIGTMNTADRSVGHIDYAIRRRFAFVDVNTDEGVIPDNAKPLFDKVKALFDVHLSEEFELTDVMIGHSYFLKGNLDLALKYEIKPILQEYRKDGVLTCKKEIINNLNAD